MSKTSKSCIKEKHEFNRQLKFFAQEQIDEFLNPSRIEMELDQEYKERDEEYYYEQLYIQDIQDGLFDDWLIDDLPDDEEEDIYDEPDWRDDVYSFDDRYDDLEFEVYGLPNYDVGSYYKNTKNQTFLCCMVGARKVLINIHTGYELVHHEDLKKVG